MERLGRINASMRALAETAVGLTAVLETIARSTAEVLGGFCAIGVISDDGDWLEPRAVSSADPAVQPILEDLRAAARLRTDGETPMARALATGEPLQLSPVPPAMLRARFESVAARETLTALGLHGILFLPLRAAGTSVGALTLARFGTDAPFDQTDLRLAQALADHAAFAIANARELARREQVETRLKLLTSLAREFTEATADYRHLLDLVTTRIGETMAGTCSARFLTEDRQWLEASGSVYDVDPAIAALAWETIRGRPVRVGDGLIGRVVAAGEPVFLPSITPAEVSAGSDEVQRAVSEQLQINSVMCVPLRARGESVGVISLSRRGSQPPFTPDDFALLIEVATHAALAITNARLLEASRRELQTEAVLRRGYLEAAPDAVLIVDAAGEIVLVNTQTEALFGYERAELIGRTIDTLVPERLRPAHPGHRADYLAQPGTRPMGAGLDLFAVRKDGTEFAAEISLSPIQTPDGTLVAAAVRDVTERRRDAEERNRRMQEANRLKSEFLANMSHELRTPLNAIIGFTQLMYAGKAGPIAELHREYLGDILTSSRHLLQLINDVLDLAKVEAGKMELRPELVEVARLLVEVRDIVRGLAAERKIRLEVVHDPAIAQITVDPRMLKQVVYNFLSNAIKFTPVGGNVWLRIAPDGTDEFRVEVEDTGVGIAPEDLGRLFVEFQQLDQGTAKRHAGTGLGLALTRRITEAHGGRVGVTSMLGAGSKFWAVWPRGGG